MASITPADPGITAASGFASPATGLSYAGKALTIPVPKDLVPVGDPVIQENFTRLQERLRPYEGGNPELYQFARFFGGAYVTGMITAIATEDGDIHFVHSLQRIPKWIALSIDLGGLGGQVQGVPVGGISASGGNYHAWTKTDIYVRATVTSTYAFVII